MTGGGLLALVAYGSQNVLLSGNPEMTFWYKTYRRYSHFSQESVTMALEGPNELFYNQPIKLRLKLQRVGDLVSDLYFTFRIPDIYSKYQTPRIFQHEYQWVRYLGAALIQNAAFYVGGQKILGPHIRVDPGEVLDRSSVDLGEIAPDDVHLAGIYVHRIVVNPTPEKRIEKRTTRARK